MGLQDSGAVAVVLGSAGVGQRHDCETRHEGLASQEEGRLLAATTTVGRGRIHCKVGYMAWHWSASRAMTLVSVVIQFSLLLP